MHVRSTASGLEVLAPAKLNLFLEVLGKRDDGFHEIETLMYPIACYDTLDFRKADSGGILLECQQAWGPTAAPLSERGSLPQGRDNLVVRAVELVRQRSGVDFGAAIRLVKRVPLAAGLAGGSSDAAAALVAASEGWGLRWPRARLATLAAELGSDVPFFLGRGPAVCRGRGERVQPVSGVGALWFVVAHPPAGLSTAAVYRSCQPPGEPRRVAALVETLRKGRIASAGQLLFNRLQQAAESLSPWIGRLKHEFARLDCLGHQMTGSGTSYFGLCRGAAHARRTAALLTARGAGRVYAVGAGG